MLRITSRGGALIGAVVATVDVTGARCGAVGPSTSIDDPGLDGYRLLEYCDRMELALAVADLAVSRAGATTVSELAVVGVPAVYVPYPVGNGEQELNARGAVAAGGAVLVRDADFTAEYVERATTAASSASCSIPVTPRARSGPTPPIARPPTSGR